MFFYRPPSLDFGFFSDLKQKNKNQCPYVEKGGYVERGWLATQLCKAKMR